ncbi:permease [Metabacillus halosaccharovorans]|uniref:permease n=1 Tax=Metabacillus halosaccharovorans TaxID=930124 RepID=UPI001C1FD2D9|nr:permease [Metabacillus halosaccharovorans]MBU7592343.1 permease [Metabacillus halosaccharovorans]
MRTRADSELIGFAFLGSCFLLFYFHQGIRLDESFFLDSFLTFNMVFISILLEALPFVLLGVMISGVIQVFVSEEQLSKFIPRNKFLAIIMSCLVGALFPACECGIVPIVRRLVGKGMPLFAGVGFLLTGPLINPLVIFSTYMAFGEDTKMALLRMVLGLIIAMMITAMICALFQQNQLKLTKNSFNSNGPEQQVKQPLPTRLRAMIEHAIDEFFDMGKFLIIGAILAAFVQTFIATKSILDLGNGLVGSTLVMMGLAYLLSLCSEADAFIAASFDHLLPKTSLLGFLIYGPMLDLKNTIMLLSVFKFRFVMTLTILITVTVLAVLLLAHPMI